MGEEVMGWPEAFAVVGSSIAGAAAFATFMWALTR